MICYTTGIGHICTHTQKKFPFSACTWHLADTITSYSGCDGLLVISWHHKYYHEMNTSKLTNKLTKWTLQRIFRSIFNASIQYWTLMWVTTALIMQFKLKCGPMPNVMAALPNIGGALYGGSVIPFLVPRRKVWLTPAAGVACSNACNIRERKTWT